MTYPKILELRPDQTHREKWAKYFLAMHNDEVKRLSPSHIHTEEKVKQGVLEL